MKDFELVHAVNRLIVFFNVAKGPGPATIAAWTPRVAAIPSDAIEFIVTRICEDCDSVPRNIPRIFREYYRQWQAMNPRPEKAVQGCASCEGGILFLERTRPDGSIETGSCFCARCTPGDPGRVGKGFLSELEALGWRSAKLTATERGRAKAQEVREQHARALKQWKKPDPRRADSYEEEVESCRS